MRPWSGVNIYDQTQTLTHDAAWMLDDWRTARLCVGWHYTGFSLQYRWCDANVIFATASSSSTWNIVDDDYYRASLRPWVRPSVPTTISKDATLGGASDMQEPSRLARLHVCDGSVVIELQTTKHDDGA